MLTSNTVEAAYEEIQDFTRFEFKYLLDGNQAENIEQEIRHFMEFDGHIDKDHGDRYMVRSLYFDTPGRTNFYDKIDGVKARRKYRLRTYSSMPSAEVPIFLEEKNRIDNRVFKYRTPVVLGDLENIISNAGPVALLADHSGNELMQRFVERSLVANEQPLVLVGYFRRAFVSNYDIDFRVTFDSQISSIPRVRFSARSGLRCEVVCRATRCWKLNSNVVSHLGFIELFNPISYGAFPFQSFAKV